MATVSCQKTIVSDAGWEMQKQAAGIAIGAAVAAYIYTNNKLDATVVAGLIGGLVPFTVGMLLNNYGKMCKA